MDGGKSSVVRRGCMECERGVRERVRGDTRLLVTYVQDILGTYILYSGHIHSIFWAHTFFLALTVLRHSFGEQVMEL